MERKQASSADPGKNLANREFLQTWNILQKDVQNAFTQQASKIVQKVSQFLFWFQFQKKKEKVTHGISEADLLSSNV